MKTIHFFLFFFCLSCCLSLNAQTPQKIGYQAVVRDEKGSLIVEQNINVRITILQNELAVYQETHSPKTNRDAMLSLKIGDGMPVSAHRFETIDWSLENYFIQIEIALKGTDYALKSTIEMLSVPYALHAKTAEKLIENPQENDPIFTSSVAKNITTTDVANWNKKLDSTDLETLKNDMVFLQKNKTDTTFVNASVQTLEKKTGIVLQYLVAQIETLEKQIADLQAANAIMEGLVSGSLIKDIDGNIYKTVKIGTQTWMAENLRVTRFNDGAQMNYVRDSAQWRDRQLSSNGAFLEPSPMYCFPDTSIDGKIKYGALYNWNVVDGKQPCPTAWHVPSMTEWSTLCLYLIAEGYNFDRTTTGNKIAKSMAVGNDWEYSDIEGSPGNTDYPEMKNASGFSAIPAGTRQDNGDFPVFNKRATWWSTTPSSYYGMKTASYTSLSYNEDHLTTCNPGTTLLAGKSIRCIKNQ